MEKQKQQQPQRLQSLDALRGFDMLFIMGGASLFVALATLFPNPFFQAIAGQMEHVEWNGLAHHDTIFPLFLFIAGISFPFSLEKQRGKGMTEGAIYKKIVRRGITLVFLGLVYNGLLSFEFDHLRCASVLARIGLGWMFAALLFVRFGWKVRAGITVLILVERGRSRSRGTWWGILTACFFPDVCTRLFLIRRVYSPPFPQLPRQCWVCSPVNGLSYGKRG